MAKQEIKSPRGIAMEETNRTKDLQFRATGIATVWVLRNSAPSTRKPGEMPKPLAE